MTNITTLPIPLRIDANSVNVDIKHVESLILGKKPDLKLSTLDQIFDFFRRFLGGKTKQQKQNELNELFDTFILKTNYFRCQSKSLNNIIDMEKNEWLYTLLCCINTIDMTEKSQIKNYTFKVDSKKDQDGYVVVRLLFNENEVSNFIMKEENHSEIISNDSIFNYNQSEKTYSIKENDNNNTLLDSVLKDFISKTELKDLPALLLPMLSIDNKFKIKKTTAEVGVNTVNYPTSDSHSQTNKMPANPENTDNSEISDFIKSKTTEQSTQSTQTNIDEFIQHLSQFKSIDEIINESKRLTVGAGNYGTAYRFIHPYDGFVVKIPINQNGDTVDYDVEPNAHPERTAKYLNKINGDGFAFSHLIGNNEEVLISKYIDGHDIYEEKCGIEEINAFLNNKGFCCYDISSPGNFKKDSSGKLYVIDVDQVVEKPTKNNPGLYSDYLLERQMAIYLKNEIKKLKKENEENSFYYNRYIKIALGNNSGITTIRQKINDINKKIHDLEAMLKLCENNKKLREDESGRFKDIIDKLA